MSEPDQSEATNPTVYKWTNKAQFQQSNLSEQAQKLLTKRSEQVEEQNVANLFSKMLRHSSVGLLYFNDQTKEMALYNIPSYISVMDMNNGHINYFSFYDDIRNRFNYIFLTGYKFGGRGANIYFSAFRNRSSFKYSFSYSKNLWERLDNEYMCNADEVNFHTVHSDLPFADSLQFILSRESRQNYIDFYNKANNTSMKFGLNQPERDLPKHSNLLALKYIYKYAPFVVTGKFGIDFGNSSIFKAISLTVSKDLRLGDALLLNLRATFANMWGRNILKNDLFFRNLDTWPGDRTKNFISPRVELRFTQFPFLSYFKFNPHLYTKLFVSFREGPGQRRDAKYQGEYGIGITSGDNKLKLDVSLFRCSMEKKGPVFGTLKFSF